MKIGLGVDTPFVLMHRGARSVYRQWPFYGDLPVAVERALDLPVVEAVQQPGPSSARQLAGLSFGEFAALTARAAAFVGNNSGPMHLAGALATPTVILQGASARNWEFYWSDVPHRTLRVENLSCAPCERLEYYPPACANRENPMACLRGVGVSQVVEALQSVLAERKIAQ
jgi:ADP-heptose:LPS heptosyltransferase